MAGCIEHHGPALAMESVFTVPWEYAESERNRSAKNDDPWSHTAIITTVHGFDKLFDTCSVKSRR